MWKRITDNKGKIGGGVFGLFLALLLIVAWPVLLVIFLIFIGITLGAGYDSLTKARRWLEGSRRDRYDEREES